MLNVNPRAAGYSRDQAVGVTHRIARAPAVCAERQRRQLFGERRDVRTRQQHQPDAAGGILAGAEGFPRAQWDVVGPLYFSTMGIPLVAGRDFSQRDDESSPRVVAINETMAQRFFAGANPIGRRLVWGDDKPTDFEIVAVVRDVKPAGPRDEPHLRFYLPVSVNCRKRGPPGSWPACSFSCGQRAIPSPCCAHSSRPSPPSILDCPSNGASIGPELVDRTLVQERMIATLSIAFGMLGVGLACIGLYGLIAYHVVQRTSEIGIRMALGAERSQVLWATLRRALSWTAGGIVLGIPLAVSLSWIAESLLFGLSPTDTATMAGAAIAMLAFGLLAAYIPAHRASRIDPLAALRYE